MARVIFPTRSLTEMVQLRKQKQRIAGTITHGVYAALNAQEDRIRTKLGVMTIGDEIDHEQYLYINDETCECKTCQFNLALKNHKG
jgi:hypothetical protein